MGLPEPPVHPVTGEPVTAEHLIQASDELDEVLKRGEYSALVTQVAGLRVLAARQTVIVRAVAAVALAAIATAAFSVYWGLRVDHNAREIDRTQQAIEVYCEQTNLDNAEARAKFLEKFGPTTPPEQQQQLADFVEVLFPQRNCTDVGTSTSPVSGPP